MSDHPFYGDIVFILIFLPFLEMMIMRENYRIFSPLTIFCVATFYLYAMPYIAQFNMAPNYFMSQLSYKQFALSFYLLRCFLYTFCLVVIPLLFRASKMQPRVAVFDPQQIRTKGVTLFVVFCFVVIIKLGIGVGFSPAAMMDRAINPREYTEVRAGLGPLFHIHLGLKYVLITLATVMVFASGKSFFSIIFFMMCVGVTLIGGTKASFVLPVIVSVVVWQKISWQYRSVFQKFRKTILIGVLVVAVVILSFALWGASGEVTGIGDAISGIVGYLKEAYYLPLVTEAFPWSPKVLSDVIADTFISPIPRAIWKNKPSKGLWSQYFRPTFEPNTVYYHTSTFGCLSEAHMLYGRLGPFVYGILWALICYKLYVYMISHDSLFKACFVAVICQWTYLLVRTGFLGVNTSTIALYMLISWFILRNTKVIYSEETEYDEYSVSELPQESYQEQYYQEHVE